MIDDTTYDVCVEDMVIYEAVYETLDKEKDQLREVGPFLSLLSKREEYHHHAQSSSKDKMSKVTNLEVEVAILEKKLRRRKE